MCQWKMIGLIKIVGGSAFLRGSRCIYAVPCYGTVNTSKRFLAHSLFLQMRG